MEASSTIILIGSVLLTASILTSVVALRFGTSLLLIFLAVGLLAGQDGIGGIPFNDAPTTFLIGSAALAIILFESGFDTRLQSYRAAAWPALTLATLGVLVTTGIIGVAAHYLLALPWIAAVLIGAVVSSTDAAAVFLLLRVGGITVRDRVRSTLEIESGSNDPMAILLTVLLVEFAQAGGHVTPAAMALEFVWELSGGALGGLAGGVLLVLLINGARLEAGLNLVVSLAIALFVFSGTAVLGGSGFLAVYVAGLVAGNVRLRGMQNLRRFHSGLTWLAQIVMFVMLGLLATPSEFGAILIPAVTLAFLLILVARPLAVWLCLLPFRFTANETSFVAWVGLRGAVSILLALVPILGHLDNGQTIFNTAFIVVIVSLLVQGWTIGPMARGLRLIVPPRTGPVERVELELPGEIGHELVAYTVHAKSAVARGQSLPRWARPSLVVREGKVVPLHKALPIRSGDRVYIFIAPGRLALLDKLMGGVRALDQSDREFYGDLALSPDATVEQIAEMYGLPLALANASRSLRALFHHEFPQGFELGDRVRMGGVELIVRDLDETGEIISVGLGLEPVTPAYTPLPLLLPSGQLRKRLISWWSRTAFRRWQERQRGRDG